MIYEVTESKTNMGEWRVEAINYDANREIYLTVFSGPKAQQRALEYANWKQGLIRKKRRAQLISASMRSAHAVGVNDTVLCATAPAAQKR